MPASKPNLTEPSSDDAKIMLRVPRNLKKELWHQATEEHRTLNGQIVFLLTMAVAERERLGGRRTSDRGGRRTADKSDEQGAAA